MILGKFGENVECPSRTEISTTSRNATCERQQEGAPEPRDGERSGSRGDGNRVEGS